MRGAIFLNIGGSKTTDFRDTIYFLLRRALRKLQSDTLVPETFMHIYNSKPVCVFRKLINGNDLGVIGQLKSGSFTRCNLLDLIFLLEVQNYPIRSSFHLIIYFIHIKEVHSHPNLANIFVK